MKILSFLFAGQRAYYLFAEPLLCSYGSLCGSFALLLSFRMPFSVCVFTDFWNPTPNNCCSFFMGQLSFVFYASDLPQQWVESAQIFLQKNILFALGFMKCWWPQTGRGCLHLQVAIGTPENAREPFQCWDACVVHFHCEAHACSCEQAALQVHLPISLWWWNAAWHRNQQSLTSKGSLKVCLCSHFWLSSDMLLMVKLVYSNTYLFQQNLILEVTIEGYFQNKPSFCFPGILLLHVHSIVFKSTSKLRIPYYCFVLVCSQKPREVWTEQPQNSTLQKLYVHSIDSFLLILFPLYFFLFLGLKSWQGVGGGF